MRETTRGYGGISIMPGWSRRLVKQDWTLDTGHWTGLSIRRNSSPLPLSPLVDSTPPSPSVSTAFLFFKILCCFPCSGSGSGSGSGLRSAGWLLGWLGSLAGLLLASMPRTRWLEEVQGQE